MLKDRRYPYLDAENILNAGKGPSEEFRIVRLPDGRYGAATRRKVREKRYFKFHERNYFTGKRWSNEDFVWFAYENDLVIAVTDKACDFSNWNNINYYYQQFRDTDNKLIYTTLIGSYISRVGSPFISVDNLDFDSYGNARLFNGRVLVNNQLSGKPVGKIASLFLERDKTDKNIYYIRRVDYWSGYGDRRYSVTKGEKGEVSISVSLKSGVPTYSIVDIKGECRKITPTASKRSCESAKIISEPEWQKVKKELEAAIKAEAEKHLVNARSLKEEDKAREAMGEYHLAFATDTLTEDEATKKEIINLSAKLCLDEAYGLLDGGYYRQAQELFEQVESFVTEDKKKFSRALAKAKVLAAYYGGLRYYDDGDYEFAIKKLNEALSYRKSLKADLIGEKKLVLIEEKLRKAEALCLYMEIRKLFLKKRYDEALDMFKQAESKGQGSYLRHLGVSLTMDLIEVCVAKEAGISESGAQMPLNEALETARLIIKNMHEHETLPAKDVIEKVLKDLNSPEAQRLLKLKPNCAKSALIKLSVARLAEMVELYDVIAEQLRDAKKDLYTELNEPAGADEMLEPYDDTGTEQQESEDESEGDFDYEARPRPDDEISKTHPAKRNKSGIAKGLAYSYNTNGSKTSYSKSWLKEIRKDVPGFEPLKNDNYKTRIEAALSDYAGTDIMKVLYKLIESSDWELVLSYILRIADQPMFTDDTREAREKLNLLEGTRNIAIGKITESKSSLAEKLLFQQVQAIEAIRTSA